MELKGLAIGRVVHYVLSPGEHRPAIITRVKDRARGTVNLHVFSDREDEHAGLIKTVSDVEPNDAIAPDDGAVGTWHWPERED